MANPIFTVDEPDGRHIVRIPPPSHVRSVQMTYKGRKIIDRKALVVFARRLAGRCVQPIGPGSSRNRTEPTIADAEVTGQVIVNRNSGTIVVPHDETRVVGFMDAGIVGDKSAAMIAQLLCDRIALMAGVVLEHSHRESMDGISFVGMAVRHS